MYSYFLGSLTFTLLQNIMELFKAPIHDHQII